MLPEASEKICYRQYFRGAIPGLINKKGVELKHRVVES